MLTGVHPLLTGELLWHLDAMGHADAVVVADAHFPATRMGTRVLAIPGASASAVLAAIRTVVPLDDDPAVDIMRTETGLLPVQHDLMAAAGIEPGAARSLDRSEFYDVAERAFLIIRTSELRPYGNAIIRKGLVV